MAFGITPDDTYDFILPADLQLPPERQTVWVMRFLSGKEREALQNFASAHGSTQAGTFSALTVKAGLVGVRNFPDRRGKEIELTTKEELVFSRRAQVPDDAFLGRISTPDMAQLVVSVSTQRVTELEAKNS